MITVKERQDDEQREQLQERERKWNHPRSSPARASLTGRTSSSAISPVTRSSRRNSTTSLQLDDGGSSKASSVVSRQEGET